MSNILILKENERICANSECLDIFTIDEHSIHCNRCDRWYCSKIECHFDCNDMWPKGYRYDTIYNKINTTCVDDCDPCEYANEEIDNEEDEIFYNKYGFKRNEIKNKVCIKK
jgi:hypothetical protein